VVTIKQNGSILLVAYSDFLGKARRNKTGFWGAFI